MSGVKRTKDHIDVFERTMQGVHTSGNREEIVGFHTERGIVGMRTKREIHLLDDTQAEREVIVKLRRLPPRRRPR